MTNTKGMDTTKQTAVEWFMGKIGEKQPNGLYVIGTLQDVQNVFQQAKEMQKQQSQQYAEFCVMCDRENLPLLDFESYILKYGGNN
jgi:hypothetical protein